MKKMAKLTLNVDARDIAAAKEFARRNRTTLSKLVGAYFRSLTTSPDQGDPVITRLHAEILARGYQPSGRSADDLRRRHVNRKYR
jgi:hypothetical protein